MAKSTMVWDGLSDYLKELEQLPQDCHDEAAKLIEGEVNHAYLTISQVYGAHRFSGRLQNRLSISTLAVGRYVYAMVLKSGSPIAWLFDNGSQARHYTGTDKSGRTYVDADRGSMGSKTPPTHIFARTVGKAKRTLTTQFHNLLVRHGAVSVTGDE
jgi:hypothetical protein